MAGTDLALNADGDFIDDGHGDWVETASIEPLCRYQLKDQRGLFFADPDAGSDVYLIPKKANRATLLRLSDAWRDALNVLVALGLSEDLVIDIDVDQVNRFIIDASMTDRNAGVVDLTPLLSSGLADDGYRSSAASGGGLVLF